ncbi:MAG TPA: SusD/RagB family nutrient-binding outer membrane lipoprotein [Pricia sp.]|nr:SusD/RagB family nutrient-binding outer membrane lipoprotein [Pricia sp.]
MKKQIFFLITVALVVSCSDFGDMNQDPKQATAVPPETVYANANKELVDLMTESSVNINIFRFFAQTWTSTTYTDEPNYDLKVRDQPGAHWDNSYRDILKDLDEARKIINNSDNANIDPAVIQNQLASISILEVFTYHVLVDVFADVPFTEALNIENVNPKYDDDAAIYPALTAKLNEAINSINVDAGSFGDSDLLYNGDMAGFKKFANSLKLRMAVRIAAVDAGTAATMASEAIASGVFESNADNATMPYLDGSPNANPVWTDLVESGRQDFIPSDVVVDIMVALDDPRIPIYFDDNLGAGVYKGGAYGQNAPYADHTHLGDIFHEPDTEGVLMDYPEVAFLLAEAEELGLANPAGTPEENYNAAVTASIQYWGAEGADAYLSQPNVAYATAGGTWQETVAVQKWIHLFNRGFEAWTTYRLYGFPDLVTTPFSEEESPRRYTYPNDEASVNPPGYQAAASAIGGDEKSSRVFWDVP